MKDAVLAIITRLKADTAITAVVSAQVYRTGSVPTNPTFPYIIVSRVDTKRRHETHNRIRTAQARVQCTAFASTDMAADNLSELIADCLNMVTDTYLAPGVFVISIFDQGTTPDSNPDIPVYMYHRDFMITHNA
jgi:hypothetical protein